MSQVIETPAPAGAATPFGSADVAQLLHDLAFAEVDLRTKRRIDGVDYDDPGMRDFSATLSLYVSFGDFDEDDLPAWYGDRSWADVPTAEMQALLSRVSPPLAELALAMKPMEEGALVELVRLHGSILDPYKLRGSLYDALDSRSGAHEALYAALTTDGTYGGIGLKPDLGDLVEGVGNVVLLTHVESSHRWEDIVEGLEAGLVSQVLQDVAAGSCAVLTWVGPLPAKTAEEKARKTYVEGFWQAASFEKWKHGIWYTSTAFQSFENPSLAVIGLLG